MLRAEIFAVSILALVLSLDVPAMAQEETSPVSSPAEVVAQVNETLISTMRDAGDLQFQGRFDRLAQVFGEAFHFGFMSRVATGGYWRDLEATQKDSLAEAFARMSIATYAARFDGYSGETFEIGESLEQPRGAVLVRNRLIRVGEEPVSIDYLLRQFDGHWRIVDVFLDGTISEIATKRSEYNSILKRNGFEGLLARIETKTAEQADN